MPTGNFGDVFAGYVAKCMGLPVETLVVATNDNDILPRAYETGIYEMRGVKATTSPSMDIQVSSNFERFLFEGSGRDAAAVRAQMGGADARRALRARHRGARAAALRFSRRSAHPRQP